VKYIDLLNKITCCLLLVSSFSCQQEPIGQTPKKHSVSPSPLFELVSAVHSGIDFKNELIEDVRTNYNVLSYEYYFNGGGVAVGDINNDGLPDLCFTGNTAPNKLYLNKGNFQFEDVTDQAGINPPNKHWATGAVFVDINDDGWQDLYICQAGPENDPDLRRNLLFINNGDGTFREEAHKWGLDDGNRSVQAAFFDYDKDGDLDCFVMNHSKYFQTILAAVFEDLTRKQALEEASSHLYRNDNGHFKRVTEEAGLLRYGYGLGLVVNDLNGDGWTDIYQANDYSVPDFMWINNGDGTFTDKTKQMTQQISFYGMGCDVADYDNDALPDIAVVDMAADDHFRDKTLMASMDTEGFWYFVNKRGYQYAYMFNSLQHNNGNGTFSNLASLADVLRTDWSWAVLFADFDLDGWKDIFVTNGYRRYARDNDFRNLMAAKRSEYGGTIPLELRPQLYEQMPEIPLPNVMFHNKGDLTFEKVQAQWGLAQPSYSNGAAWADLDRDGDLDLVVNNLDQEAFVYRNKAVEQQKGHFLSIHLKGKPAEVLNTRITIHTAHGKQYWEYHPVRGYQSCMGQEVHFGLGPDARVEAIDIFWPDGKYSRLEQVDADQILTIRRGQLPETSPPSPQAQPLAFEKVNPATLGIQFRHIENFFDDFTVQVLLPHKQSTLGPRLAVADVNNDGLKDFFIGGAGNQSGQLYLQQTAGTFALAAQQPWSADATSEDMQPLFFDPNQNGDVDLYIVSGGGAEYPEGSAALQDRFYANVGQGTFFKTRNALPQMFHSGATAVAADFDGDGDEDLFVGGQAIPGHYPFPERSYILRNDGKTFVDVTASFAPELLEPGIVTDAIVTDFNNDDMPDLIVVGEWMPVLCLQNEGGHRLKDVSVTLGTHQLKGWWYSIAQADIDNDGDTDYILGNLGLNSKFSTSHQKPLYVFAGDFDHTGTTDIVLTKEYKGKLVPTRGRQCSSEQMPFIKEKFPTYRDFALASVNDILGKEGLEEALHLEVNEFGSGILRNEDGQLLFERLPNLAQAAPINGIIAEDLDGDGWIDLIVAGNKYHTEVETPRYDAGTGLILLNDGTGHFTALPPWRTGFFVPGNVKDLALIPTAKGKLVLVANNDGPLEVFRLARPEALRAILQ